MVDVRARSSETVAGLARSCLDLSNVIECLDRPTTPIPNHRSMVTFQEGGDSIAPKPFIDDGTSDFSQDSCERSRVGWAPCKARREASVSHSSWRASNACSEGNRHQRAPLLAYTWELGVILTARAPNRRRSSRAFCGRDDAGPDSPNTRRENGHNHFARHRPRGAADRRRRILLQTQGLSRKGRWLAGIDAGAPCPSVLCHTAPRGVGPYG